MVRAYIGSALSLSSLLLCLKSDYSMRPFPEHSNRAQVNMAKRKREGSGSGDAVKHTRVGTHFMIYYSSCRMATYNISLLLVSRQVYTGCALLPYKLSTFSFSFTAPIRKFLEARTKQQLRSIEDMHVFGTFGGSNRDTGSSWFEYLGCEKKRCSDR
ncbi:hypothetical protein IG631_14351 [Alternaria alternata]|nr:hypothetical protein IG631_14351 [Alternaria alternata]